MQTLPQNMAALIVRHTAPSVARLTMVATAKGKWQPLLVLEFDGGYPIAVSGRSGDGLRKWASRHGMAISPYSEADDDKIFALTCARKNARTDADAAAIAWAEDEIETLRRERDEAVSQLNHSYGERMLPGAPGPRLDP